MFVSVYMCASVGVFMLLAGHDSVWAFHEKQKQDGVTERTFVLRNR